jgi:hypothetical protein
LKARGIYLHSARMCLCIFPLPCSRLQVAGRLAAWGPCLQYVRPSARACAHKRVYVCVFVCMRDTTCCSLPLQQQPHTPHPPLFHPAHLVLPLTPVLFAGPSSGIKHRHHLCELRARARVRVPAPLDNYLHLPRRLRRNAWADSVVVHLPRYFRAQLLGHGFRSRHAQWPKANRGQWPTEA